MFKGCFHKENILALVAYPHETGINPPEKTKKMRAILPPINERYNHNVKSVARAEKERRRRRR